MEINETVKSCIKNKKSFSVRPEELLTCLYVIGVVLRFILGFFFRHGPTVQIDESLYINIAKSLAAGEGVAYRCQPIPYMYIFYPLLLAPLYLFPLPFDLYRVIQLYNSLLITTSIFPVYLFAKDFTGSRRKALLASFLILLMPDMQMAGFQMAESIVWPLSSWLIFFSCRLFLFNEKKILNGVLTGLFCALLFWTKPGSIAMGLALLLSALFLGDPSSSKKRRSAVLAGFIVCIGLIISFYALYVFVFGYDLSLLGLYNKQLTVISPKWFLAVVEFSFLQLLLFAIACGGACFVIPYACFNKYEESRQSFLSAFTVGLFITAIGTAALVDMFLWNGSFTNPQLHLRYMAMYVPVMVVFSLAVNFPDTKNLPLAVSLFVAAILSVFPGASVGFVKGESTYIDSLALSAWLNDFHIPHSAGIILTVLLVLFLAYLSLQAIRGKFSLVLQKLTISFLSFFLLFNTICGYIACNFHRDLYDYGIDAIQMNILLENLSENVLIVTGDYHDPSSYLLEARLRKPQQIITIEALKKALSETDGYYVPFIPEDEAPNVDNHLTPDTDRFLFTSSAIDYIETSSYTTIQESQNSGFTQVHLPKDSLLVDTILSGVSQHVLSDGAQAHLAIFNDSRYRNGKLTLHLIACSETGTADLLIENADNTEIISLSENPRTCIFSLIKGETILTALGGNIKLYSYWTT